ncbi:hypothetical protein SLV14_000406 [Streptomyces sp. Je 1-4]|uniref:hypothetical protein n=1 Tax=Streptomyces TaxID=1883 RepID=UPI0021D7D5DB|nr:MULTISPECIES: hypothetical protein [unclassified Streptomyces]UYB38080.1 hypothetical protein SLV14_000406 [Streptomyces sp. Je 1-4]UZQ34017.1 hypothetical protein SLV14N_000406 [Streptomyces sp. Je 1-4] [Streptomyces sp. Je 1-4 4N24]UZQ41435.1 hypothetical protein SLV14NA_000406 [Streptomyces sp. Je 1-4] [Streptomyces sp. Je 1-4 4N24_ara]
MRARHLATAAVLALTTALLAAAPAPAQPSATAPPPDGRFTPARPAGHTEVPVEGGSARFATPPALLAALKAHGVVIANVDAQGTVTPHHDSGGISLGIKDGAVTNSGGKVGGELRFADSGIALINRRTNKVVKVTGFTVDLGQGALRARLDRGQKMTVGTFTRPGIAASIDTDAARLRMDTGVTVTAAAAAQLNAALGTTGFTGGGPLLHVRVDAALDPSVDLATALNLGHRPAPSDTGRRSTGAAGGGEASER